jgi:hypothetical protein
MSMSGVLCYVQFLPGPDQLLHIESFCVKSLLLGAPSVMMHLVGEILCRVVHVLGVELISAIHEASCAAA